MNPTADEYGEILNSEDTYQFISEMLNKHDACFIGWTDGRGTHLDILFTIRPAYYPEGYHNFQGGVRPADLFVSIMKLGAFGFNREKAEYMHPSYYAEKLGGGLGTTAAELADLINGVRQALLKK